MDAAEQFHLNVTKLYKKTQEPCPPETYRGKVFESSNAYLLLHEEEQHLADHLAFLAQAQEGSDFVSAVMLEECRIPPSLTVRLAANKTPKDRVVQGLKEVFKAVEQCARSDIKSDQHQSAIFTKVVELSHQRLYARFRSSLAKKRKWPPLTAQAASPLWSKVQSLLPSIPPQPSQSANSEESLVEKLNAFIQSLEEVDNGGPEDQIKLLETAITRSFDVSHTQASKSLETYLQSLGFVPDASQSRIILEIDKISRYLELCNDLTRLSRRSRCRAIFSDIRLEVLTAPPTSQPAGASMPCHVHGEVQLIMFYEQHPLQLPPRTIGSSKSACFLCDLFIRKHGGYHISHSHKRLYEPWTLPSVWREEEHKAKFLHIFREMDKDLMYLMRTYERPPLYEGNGPESRAHLLVLPNGSVAMTPTMSIGSAITTRAATVSPPIEIRTLSVNPLAGNSVSSTAPLRSVCYFQDLPVKINFSASTISCTLLVGKVDYIFDLEEVESGQLLITSLGENETTSKSPRINVQDLSSSLETRVQSPLMAETITFCVHDAEEYQLLVMMTFRPN